MTSGSRTAAETPTPQLSSARKASGFARHARLALASHPEWLAWSGLTIALICLFQSLGLTDAPSLGIWISSDTLWLVNVFTDLFRDGYSLAGWHFSIAPCWFPDVALAGLFWALTQNVILATLLSGFVQVALLIGALRVIGKALGVRSAEFRDSVLLLVGVGIALYVARAPGNYYPGLYKFFLTQSHVGSLLSVVWGWTLFLLILCRRREAKRTSTLVILYAFLCTLAGMSNLLFFPQMLAPISAALLGGALFGVIRMRECWLPLAAGWLSAALGAVLNRVLFTTSDVGVQAGLSRERALTALDTFRRGFAAKLLACDPLHVIALVWLIICAGYIAWTVRDLIVKGRSTVPSSQVIRAVFFATCFLSSLLSVATIILGGSNGLVEFKDYIWTMHYFHPAFLLPLFTVPMTLSWAIEKMLPARMLGAAAWVTAALAFVVPTAHLAAMPSPKAPIYAYRPPLVRFMDETAATRHLHYGLAGYWQARLITLLSTKGLRAYAVDGGINPLLWVSNEQWYQQSIEDRKRPPHVDFVVLDDPLWKISREAAVQVFGQPAEELNGDGAHVLIYSK
jgi:hypothetical protein